MTEEEYSKLKHWDIIKNKQRPASEIIVSKKDDNGCELLYLSGFTMWIPKSHILSGYKYLENCSYHPTYDIISKFLELYKRYEEERPSGYSPSMYIHDNFNK